MIYAARCPPSKYLHVRSEPEKMFTPVHNKMFPFSPPQLLPPPRKNPNSSSALLQTGPVWGAGEHYST